MRPLEASSVLFSVIVPVYNVEPYLSACLDALLPALDEDCELILATGRSTDRSNAIALAYERTHERISVVEQTGTGLSNARNCGVRAAAGQFLLYIDSDDLVDPVSLGALLSHIRANPSEADVYMTDYYRLYRSGTTERIEQIGKRRAPLYGLAHLPDVLSRKQCFWNVWRFVYRRSFLARHQIVFLENRNSEDLDYTTQVLLGNPRVVFWHTPFYFYRVGWGRSLMDVVSLGRVQDVTFVIERCLAALARQPGFAYQTLLAEQYRYEYLLNLALLCEVKRPDRPAARAAFQNWKQVLRPARARPVRLFYGFLSLFGLRAGGRVLLALKRMKRALTRNQ